MVWTVPAEGMKAGREHRVPLTDQAIAIVKGLIEPGETYVFHNEFGCPLSNATMMKALRAVRDDGPTVHGFRSSFRDWAAEQTDAPREVVEACLAHAVGDAEELALQAQRLPGKAAGGDETWGAYCLTQRPHHSASKRAQIVASHMACDSKVTGERTLAEHRSNGLMRRGIPWPTARSSRQDVQIATRCAWPHAWKPRLTPCQTCSTRTCRTTLFARSG